MYLPSSEDFVGALLRTLAFDYQSLEIQSLSIYCRESGFIHALPRAFWQECNVDHSVSLYFAYLESRLLKLASAGASKVRVELDGFWSLMDKILA